MASQQSLLLLLAAPGPALVTAAPSMRFGPPIPLGGGGKMSNTLDMGSAGFASGSFAFFGPPRTEGVVFSADGGATYHKAAFNMSVNRTWDSFVTYRNGSDVWAHDFGTYHECIPGQTANGAHATADGTSVTSQPTMTYRFVDGQLTEKPGPPVTFSGLPVPVCGAGGNTGKDAAFVGMTPYAGGQLVLPDGTHLVTTMYPACAPGKPRNGGISLFSSADGYNFTFRSNVARQSDSRSFAPPAEGPNEHTITLLPNGNILCVFRTEAGDGNGHYGPYYRTVSTDQGKTWATATPLKDASGNYMGCARPHMVQLGGNTTLLVGGRMMMGHDYSRAFSVWLSHDGNGQNWSRADGSYHLRNTMITLRALDWLRFTYVSEIEST